MKITKIDAEPFHVLPYLRVKKGGKGVELVDLPFYKICVDRLSSALSALLITSDLQGVECKGHTKGKAKAGSRLLGHVVTDQAPGILREQGIEASRTGVLLAGDMHSDVSLERRGGFGDVREVWRAFRDTFKWVAGVAGNHDYCGEPEDIAAFRNEKGVHLLVSDVVTLDGVRLGGVSGVIGRSAKPWRNSEAAHGSMIQRVVKQSPALLLLHEGPSINERGLEGSDVIRRQLESCRPCTVICGHKHWPGNVAHPLSNGMQVLNSEGKVLVLVKEGHHACV